MSEPWRAVPGDPVLDAALDVVDMEVEEARQDKRRLEAVDERLDGRDEAVLEPHDARPCAEERVDEEAVELARHPGILPALERRGRDGREWPGGRSGRSRCRSRPPPAHRGAAAPRPRSPRRDCLARIRERDGAAQPRGRRGVRERVDCASLRGGSARGRGARRRRARASPVLTAPRNCAASRSASKICTASRAKAADRVEQPARRAGRSRTATSGARLRAPGDDPARPPPHARVRGRRDDRPGRQPVGARPLSGGSSGGSAAALAARMVPAATGTDTADRCGSRPRCAAPRRSADARPRVDAQPSSPLATEPRSRGADGAHARRIARRSWPRWRGPIPAAPEARSPPAARGPPAPRTGRHAAGRRSPRALAPHRRARSTPTSPTASMPRSRSAPRWEPARRAASAPGRPADVGDDFLDVLYAELLTYHRRFDGGREHYRPSLREWVEQAEARARLGRALSRRADAAPRNDCRPRPVARRLPDLGPDPADGAVRRTPARRRLRPRRQRLRPDLAHALLGLDGLPGRRAAGGVGSRSGLPVGVSL